MTPDCGCTGLGPHIVRSQPPKDSRIRLLSSEDVSSLPEYERERPANPTTARDRQLPSVTTMDRRHDIPTGWWQRSRQVKRSPLSTRPDMMARLAAASGCTLSAHDTRRLLFDLDDLALDTPTLPLVMGAVRGMNAAVIRNLITTWSEADRLARPLPATDIVTNNIDEPDIYLTFSGGWAPPLDDDSRHTTLAGVWEPYWSDKDRTLAVGYDFARAAACIRSFEASRAPGLFWDEDGGPAWKTILHALRLITTYNHHIGVDGEYCPDARHEVVDWLFKYNWLRVKDHNGAGTFEMRKGLYGLPREINGSGIAGRAYLYNSSVRQNPSFLEAYAQTTDLLLWQAHRATWYVYEGRVEDSIIGAIVYWTQATWLGDLALAAVAEVSQNLIHEMCHLAFDPSFQIGRDDHCEANCCHERMSAKWFLRTAAWCGLVQCSGNEIDYQRTGRFWGSSTCDDDANQPTRCPGADPDGGLFCWSGTMVNPGIPSSSESWTKGGGPPSQNMDWSSPGGCP